MHIGMGYDVHRLVPDRDLIMGGVKIPYEKGLLGHSDADVLLHAIMDALLGAAALGDIGKHFPDTDPKYKGADSLALMREVGKMLDEFFAGLDLVLIFLISALCVFLCSLESALCYLYIREDRFEPFYYRFTVFL